MVAAVWTLQRSLATSQQHLETAAQVVPQLLSSSFISIYPPSQCFLLTQRRGGITVEDGRVIVKYTAYAHTSCAHT